MRSAAIQNVGIDVHQPTLVRVVKDGVIHHSDQRCRYTSIEFGKRCREAGVRPSMGSVGDCFDNAMSESFFATLECELIDRSTFRTQDHSCAAILDFIEGFYNSRRRHSSIGCRSPVQFEKRQAVFALHDNDTEEGRRRRGQ